MSAGHTPGPWFCDGRLPGKSEYAVFAEDGVACVALIQPGCLPAKGRDDAAAANARLVAAAPELLSALSETLSAFHALCQNNGIPIESPQATWTACRAIAKATTGEQVSA